MIDELSLDITKINFQKAIIKQLYKRGSLSLSEYNVVISKFDKKQENIMKKNKNIKKSYPLNMDVKI